MPVDVSKNFLQQSAKATNIVCSPCALNLILKFYCFTKRFIKTELSEDTLII